MPWLHDAASARELAYDDVFLVPVRSNVDSRLEVDVATRDGSGTTIPVAVSNMTAVAGRRMAETVHVEGLAVIPQDIPVDVVADVTAWVKSRHTIFETPITLQRADTVGDALNLLPKRAHGAVVVVDGGRPVGLVTEVDCQGIDRFTQLGEVMSTELMVLPATVEPREAFETLATARRRLAPVIDDRGHLVGLVTRTGRCGRACTDRRSTRRGGCG